MNISKHTSIKELPGRSSNGGYVYALCMTDNLVKIGMSNNPKSRIDCHIKNFQCYGSKHEFKFVFLTPEHSNYSANESVLIDTFSDDVDRGNEFLNIEYSQVVDQMELLDFVEILKSESVKKRKNKRKHFRITIEETFYDLDELVGLLKSNKRVLEKKIREGEIKGSKRLGKWFVLRSDLIKYIEEGKDLNSQDK